MTTIEREKLLFKLAMLYYKHNKISVFSDRVNSLVFYKNTILSLKENINIKNLSKLTDEQLIELADSVGIPKRPIGAKCDIYIDKEWIMLANDRKYSGTLLKFSDRKDLQFPFIASGTVIKYYESAVTDYWNMFQRGEVSTVTRIADDNCPFAPYYKKLKPFIQYFIFCGTTKRFSNYPANKIVYFSDPLDKNTYRMYTPDEVFDLVWPRLAFHIRPKKDFPTDCEFKTYDIDLDPKPVFIRDPEGINSYYQNPFLYDGWFEQTVGVPPKVEQPSVADFVEIKIVIE